MFSTDLNDYWQYLVTLFIVGIAVVAYAGERRRVKMRVRRLTMLYAALTHCNQAIVRCGSKEELLPEVCKIAVLFGGMKMAWIGLLDEAGKQIVPLASYGEGTQFLEGIRISTDESDPYGRGPSGTAVRENRPYWCQDFRNDPNMVPWHERGMPLNWGSTATVPLCRDGRPFAAFSLYTDQINAFDDDAQGLMTRMGQDISYALENYEREAERRRNEEILHGESLETLSQRDNALKEITQGVLIANADRIATYINDAFTRQTGYTREDVIGKRCTILHGPETSIETVKYVRKLLNANQPFQGEVLNYRKDGTTFWNDLTITPVFDEEGTLVQWVGVQRDITERKAANARILRLSQLYAALSHCNNAIVHSESAEQLFPRICRSAVEFGGMQLAWIGMVSETRERVLPIASYGNGQEYLESLSIHLDEKDSYRRSPTGMAVRSGQPFWCQDFQNDLNTANWHEMARKYGISGMAALPLRKDGVAIGCFTLYAGEVNAFDQEARSLLMEMAQDVGFALENFEREEARRRAEEQLHLAANVFAQSNEAIIVADATRKIVMVNKAYTDMSGYSEQDVRGKDVRMMYTGFMSDETISAVIDSLDKTGHWQGEIWNQRKNGETYLEWLSVSAVFDQEGQLTHYVATTSDITQRKQDEERMHWLSHFDPLTGLPNRTLLEDRCRQAIRIAQSGGEPLALMFLDLDHFKNINETLGHRVGDMLLVELSNRLTFIAREQDTLSRMGGDDFVLVLPGINAAGAAHMAERVQAAIAHPFQIEEHELSISGSLGIAMYPIDGDDFDSLIKCADMAVYRAKQDGRNTFCFFTAEIQARTVRTLQLENALRRALERDQLMMYYQPQVSLADQRIVGAEALLRWQHPELGMVSPAEFIPIAENSGLILSIGEWAMRAATRQMNAWIDAGFGTMTMSVNLSAAQFRQPDLPQLVMQILEETGLPPEHFEIELTESVAMENPQAAIEVMDDLSRRGIRLSIDDFGTGYSSLAHLKRFQVYKLKIDRSFVIDVAENSEDRAIVRAIINLASSLGLRTIAEGVETEQQLAFLQQSGCHEIQGYYFSRPLTAEQFEVLLRTGYNSR